MHQPPGTRQPRPRRQIDWELVACGFAGHALVGLDADSWLALLSSASPSRPYQPERDVPVG